MGCVAGLWRYPVKSAGGERAQHLDVTAEGVVGDRLWGVLDAEGVLVSAKHPVRGGRLLSVACRYLATSGETLLQVPGLPELTAGMAEADAAVSAWLERPVRLTKAPVPNATLRRWWPSQRDLVPAWETGAVAGTDAITPVAGAASRDSLVDYGALHVILADDLRRFAAQIGRDIDPRRFRPNVIVDAPREARDADRMRVGSVTVVLGLPTPRCAVPGLSPQDASLDPALLRELARYDRRQVGPLGKAACFGRYATAENSGRVSVGDEVTIL